MPKGQLIAVIVVIVLALGAAFWGRTSGKLEDGDTRIKAALKARDVSVLVITKGRGPAETKFLSGVKAAIAGQQRVRLVHVDTTNSYERETAERFHGAPLPMVVVVGLDGEFGYIKSGQVEPEAIKAAIAEGLTKPPVKIEEGHHHH